ncbi:hypothetical protein C8Q77DRAFT_116978 [Trametes polyzona]|nr:hypothetical protein C8Q77DRAFT_116978 [Trametes polyzona]
MGRVWRSTLSALVCVSSVIALDIIYDDSLPDIIYDPPAQWVQGSGCKKCAIRPDPSQAEQKTWHDATYMVSQTVPSISFTFTGVAVKVWNILPASLPKPIITHVDLTFELDGVLGEPFTYNPPANASYQYNVNVFAAGDLDGSIEHKLVIRPRSGVPSNVLLDSIVVTVPDSTTSPQIPTATISTTATVTTTATVPQAETSAPTSSVPVLQPSPLHSSTTVAAPPSLQPITTAAGSSTPSDTGFAAASAAQATSAVGGRQDTGPSLPGSSAAPPTPSQPPLSANSSSTDRNAIIGGAVGGSLLVVLSLLVYLCYRRVSRRRKRLSSLGNDPSRRLQNAAPNNDTRPINQVQCAEVGTSIVHRPRLPGLEEDPFLDPNRASSFVGREMILPVGFTPPGDSTSAFSSEDPSSRSAEAEKLHDAHSGPARSRSARSQDAVSTPSATLSEAYEASSVGSVAVRSQGLRDELAALREEVARMRLLQQESGILLEAPPRYHEGEGTGGERVGP